MCDWLVAVFDRMDSQFLCVSFLSGVVIADMVHSQFLCVLSWVVMVDMVHSQFVCVTGWLLFLTWYTVSFCVWLVGCCFWQGGQSVHQSGQSWCSHPSKPCCTWGNVPVPVCELVCHALAHYLSVNVFVMCQYHYLFVKCLVMCQYYCLKCLSYVSTLCVCGPTCHL